MLVISKYKNSNKVMVSNFELFLFIFSIVFFTQFNGYDLRIMVLFFWLMKSLFVSKGQIYFRNYQIVLLLMLLFITSYSLIVTILVDSSNLFYSMRFLRALVTFITIIVYFSVHDIKLVSLVKVTLISVLIHSLFIYSEIIIPETEFLINHVNGYSKKSLDWRASGMFSGYDFAGTFLNLGIFLAVSFYMINKKKVYLIFSLIFTISVFMTSRVSMVILLFTLFTLMILAFINGRKRMAISLFSLISLFTSIVILFFTLSMNVFINIRQWFLSKIPLFERVYTNMVESYARYNIGDTIDNQTISVYKIEYIFGTAQKANVDPGYINIISAIGYIGLIFVLLFYLYLLIRSFNVINHTKKSNVLYITSSFTAFIIIITLLMEFKLSFLFSTGIFEILIIYFVATEEKITPSLLRQYINFKGVQ